MSKAQERLLVAIFLVAGLSRFLFLDSIASGIHPDEAMNGNEGLRAITTSSPQLFYPANYGREGFFINLVGTSVWAFGANRFGLRFWSAMIGLAAVPLIYGLGRELFNRNVGLWSAFLLATSFWHLNFSRIAFRAILVPTLFLAAFYGLLRAWRTGQWPWAVAGGLAFGLGFHSYIVFRIAPLIALALLLNEGLRRFSRKWVILSSLWAASALAIAAPMAWHFVTHPADFTARTGQLSILSQNGAVKTLATAVVKSALMFNWKGDCNQWHNLACDPQLPLPLGALFAVGMGLALWGLRSLKGANFVFVLMWLGVMLLPAIFAWEGTPHALRSIGAIPAVFLLTAVGADFAFRKLPSQFTRTTFLAVVVVAGGFEYYRYFGKWASSAGALERSKSHLVDVAQYLNSLDAQVPRFVIVNDYGALDPLDPSHPEHKVYTAAQPVIFLTQGHLPPSYVLVDDLFATTFPPGSVVVPLSIDPRIFQALRDRGISLAEETHPGFVAARVQ